MGGGVVSSDGELVLVEEAEVDFAQMLGSGIFFGDDSPEELEEFIEGKSGQTTANGGKGDLLQAPIVGEVEGVEDGVGDEAVVDLLCPHDGDVDEAFGVELPRLGVDGLARIEPVVAQATPGHMQGLLDKRAAAAGDGGADPPAEDHPRVRRIDERSFGQGYEGNVTLSHDEASGLIVVVHTGNPQEGHI